MIPNDPIKHVVLLMLENHSFDQMLGALQDVYPALDGVSVESPNARFNENLAGQNVYQAPTDAQQIARDPKHETENVLKQLEDGNSGFVRDFQRSVAGVTKDDCEVLMGFYALDRLPALHQLGREFTVCDRWFSSLPGPTWPNRFFALSGTSCGRVLMPNGIAQPRPGEFVAQDQITLFDRLNEARKSWKIYFYDFPISLLFNHQRRAENLANYSLIKNFYRDTQSEATFPAFTFIEPKYLGADQNDDHPPHNVFKAEKLIADVYNAIRSNSTLWESTLLVVTYDEHGGFYDHVQPPAAIPPDDHNEEWTFDRLGLRVPAILVSPWVGKCVNKTEFDHTSLLRYLVDKWDLGSLGRRTATANSIASALDQTQPRSDTIPFIRVPYTNLMPDQPALEQEDESRHHRAIHAFAHFLAVTEATVAGELVAEIARGAGVWILVRRKMAALFRRVAEAIGQGPQRHVSDRNRAVEQVAKRRIANGQEELASRAGL